MHLASPRQVVLKSTLEYYNSPEVSTVSRVRGQLAEVKERNTELHAKVAEADRQKDELKKVATQHAKEYQEMEQAAEAEAPELSQANRLKPPGDAIWAAYEDEEGKLEAEIEALKDDVDGSSADASSLRDFERRQKR